MVVIMKEYTELYAWIWYSFREDPFSIDDFRATFPSFHSAKVLHDLAKKSYLKRISRGMYEATKPDEWIEKIVKESTQKDNILNEAVKKYAYCESTAVSIWSNGYYWTGFTKGFKPKHIKVREKDLAYWKNFFKEKNAKCSIEGKNETLYGLVYILHPRKDFSVVEKNGFKVVPLEEVLAYCSKHRLVYQPAIQHLRK